MVTAMTRADRRARTETVRDRRRRQVSAIDPARVRTQRVEGKMRSMSPFDCGRPRCGVCHTSKKWKAKSERVKARAEARGRV